MERRVNKLRNRESVTLWDSSQKLFIRIQLNKSDNRICWQRFVSTNRRNWTKWNDYLRLKDVVSIWDSVILNRQTV